MEMAILAVTVGTTLMAGAAANQQGKSQQKLANQAAGQEEAAGQRKAIEARRRTAIMSSRAQAVAAASGGGAVDPTVVNLMAGLVGEGETAAQTIGYESKTRAANIRHEGATARYNGKVARNASYMKALGQLGSGLMSKYSPTGGGFDAPAPAGGKPSSLTGADGLTWTF